MLPNSDRDIVAFLALPRFYLEPDNVLIERREMFYRYFDSVGGRIWCYNYAKVETRKNVIQFIGRFKNVMAEWIRTLPEGQPKREEEKNLEKLIRFYWIYASINR